jgi:hypothetical protein
VKDLSVKRENPCFLLARGARFSPTESPDQNQNGVEHCHLGGHFGVWTLSWFRGQHPTPHSGFGAARVCFAGQHTSRKPQCGLTKDLKGSSWSHGVKCL